MMRNGRLFITGFIMAAVLMSGCITVRDDGSRSLLVKCKDIDADADSLHTASYVLVERVGSDDMTYKDECATENTLYEYECGEDNKVRKVQYNCFEMFQTRCYNGECG